jgi:hypothetical protein
MPSRSDDPLRRVTLNLYEADCIWLEKTYGRGWTERIRQHIHNEVLARGGTQQRYRPTNRTLGDLADDQ